jgi:glyoxylate/hydroxypyruvate reductase
MTLLVAVQGWDAQAWAARFQTLLPDVVVAVLGDDIDPASVRHVVCWRHTPGSLVQFTNVGVIFSLGAGVDHMISDPALPKVPLIRIVDPDLTNRMSEYVVMHCLMHLRQQRRYDAQARLKLWDDDRAQPAAQNVRVGIMGLGQLGRDAARKLTVMGFKVAGWSRSPRTVPELETFAGSAELPEFLARTDILVCLLPLTAQTRGILNKNLFKGLARDGRLGAPVLINAGRGGLQVESDILSALADGTLSAATLDVFESEPLPASSPLWIHPAVTVTPHNAAMSEPEAVAGFIVTQMARMAAGEQPDGLVDRASGY